MAEIKFYKANNLPASPTSADDGIWFIADGANNYKHFVITGGVVKELTVTGAGGGSAEWGEITGTLSDQTDLQSALGGKSNVGHTHDYGDLNDLPTIPEDVSDLSDTTNLLFSGDYDDLTNKPTIPAQVNLTAGPNIDITGTYPNLTIEASGGSTAEWGEISGTLADQTDLMTALNLKANDNAVVKLTGNQTVAGTKTFTTPPVVPSKSTAATNAPTVIATEAQVFLKANDADVVKLTGNQTVAGVKTFSSFPVTPSSAPTTDYQAANKKYVDDQIAGVVMEWDVEDW